MHLSRHHIASHLQRFRSKERQAFLEYQCERALSTSQAGVQERNNEYYRGALLSPHQGSYYPEYPASFVHEAPQNMNSNYNQPPSNMYAIPPHFELRPVQYQQHVYQGQQVPGAYQPASYPSQIIIGQSQYSLPSAQPLYHYNNPSLPIPKVEYYVPSNGFESRNYQIGPNIVKNETPSQELPPLHHGPPQTLYVLPNSPHSAPAMHPPMYVRGVNQSEMRAYENFPPNHMPSFSRPLGASFSTSI